jgi:hypothetical protein
MQNHVQTPAINRILYWGVASRYANRIPTLGIFWKNFRKNYDKGVTARKFEERGNLRPLKGGLHVPDLQALPEDAVQHTTGPVTSVLGRCLHDVQEVLSA